MIFALAVEKIIEFSLKSVFFVPRPYIVNYLPTLVAIPPVDSSFFSGHAAAAASIATVIFLKHRKTGILLFIVSLSIGSSRVLANVHYPIDIFGGLIIGVIIGVFCDKIVIYARHHHSTSAKRKRAKRK